MLTVTTPSDHYLLPDDRADALGRLIAIIDGTQHTLHGLVYVLAHPALRDALTRAVARGIDVELICDVTELRSSTPDLCDLIAAGLPTSHLDAGQSELHSLIHDKVLVSDSTLVVEGSLNFTVSGFKQDQNMVVTADPRLAALYLDAFTRLRNTIRATQPKNEAQLAAMEQHKPSPEGERPAA